jgi:hypothetical protein
MPRLTWSHWNAVGAGLNFGPHRRLALVSPKGDRWYWTAAANPDFGITYRNTSATPKATIEEAKGEAEGYVRAALRAKGLVK